MKLYIAFLLLFFITPIFSQIEIASNEELLRELQRRGAELSTTEQKIYIKKMNAKPVTAKIKASRDDMESVLNQYFQLKVADLQQQSGLSMTNTASGPVILDANGQPMATTSAINFGALFTDLLADLVPFVIDALNNDVPHGWNVFKWTKNGKKIYRNHPELRDEFGF